MTALQGSWGVLLQPCCGSAITQWGLGTSDKAGVVALRHRGLEAALGVPFFYAYRKNIFKKAWFLVALGLGLSSCCREGSAGHWVLQIWIPWKTVCALPALPARGIPNPAPIPMPAEGTAGFGR